MGSRSTILMVLATAVIASGIAYFIGASIPNIPPPPPSSSKAEIVIKDEHVIAWMPLNNFFSNGVNSWAHEDPHWKGVLIQLGNYAGGTYPLMPEPWSVTVEGTTGQSRTYTRASTVKWLNVLAMNQNTGKPDHPKEAPPMDSSHVGFLFAGCPLPPASAAPAPDCRMTKSLHFGFAPEKVITFWPGAPGYDLKVSLNQGASRLLTFTSNQNLVLEEDGVPVTALGKIKRMTIAGAQHNRHWDNEDPPWPIP